MRMFFILILIFIMTHGHAALIDGLAAYYALNGNFLDGSGNGKNGTSYGGVTSVSDRFGNANSAYYFDGSDDYVALPTSIISGTNQLTYSVWVNVPVYSSTGWPVFIGSYASNAGYNLNLGIYQNTGRFYTEVHTNVGNYYTAGANITWNTWVHVAMVYNGSTVTEYVNGVVTNSFSATGNIAIPTGLYLGQYAPGYTKLTGSLDEVYIYNRALSSTEISTLMNQGAFSIPEANTALLFVAVYMIRWFYQKRL